MNESISRNITGVGHALMGIITALTIGAASAVAQTEPPPAEPAAPAAEQQSPPVADDDEDDRAAPPSLDDLLELAEDERSQSAEDAARTEQEEELRRRLSEERIAGAFTEAIEKMVLSANLLDERFDAGLGTQRVQEEILAKLDELIDEAEKQPQGQNCSSSSSQSQDQSQQPNDPGRQDQSQQQQQQAAGQAQPSGESQEGTPPPMRQEDLDPFMDETRQEWGALPERIRDMLLQGRQEKFSSLYEQLTREYYRRLAEE